MSFKEVLDIEDDEITQSVQMPKTCLLSKQIFMFLSEFVPSCFIFTMAGVGGVDRFKLDTLALSRGINLTRYDSIVGEFADKAVASMQSKK